MRSAHLRRAALTLSMTGLLAGTALAAPAFAAPQDVSGTAFWDLDGNTTRSEQEAAAPGVLVTLHHASDPSGVVTQVTADPTTGEYTFTSVTPGDYLVSAGGAHVPLTVTDTEPPAPRNVPAYTGWVMGEVFWDADRDGEQGDEGPAPNTAVTLTRDGQDVQTTVTDSSGAFRFWITPGTYSVRAAGGLQITTTVEPRTLAAGESADLSVGVAPQREAQMRLLAFHDMNGNGVQDDGETGFPVPMAYSIASPDRPGFSDTGITGEDGTDLTSMLEGDYKVTFTPLAGTVLTTTSPVDVTVDADLATPATALVGIAIPVVQDGIVYIDVNENKTFDTEETLVQGATVVLTRPDSPTLRATTGADGSYSIEGILPGEYAVTVTLPDSYADQVSSLVDTETYSYESGVDVTMNYRLTHAVAEDVAPGALRGNVFIDANKNRTFDTGETPLAGTILTLTGPDGTKHTTTVGSTGAYSFTDLPPGEYDITVQVADAYKDKVSNPTLSGKVTIGEGKESVIDYFISGAVTPSRNTGTGTGSGTSTPTTTSQARTTPTSTRQSGQLARTGVESVAQTGAALSFIAMGAALLAWRRRRTI